MPRSILPSQAVAGISAAFPFVSGPTEIPTLSGGNSPAKVAQCVALIELVPEHLLLMAPDAYATFVQAFALLRAMSRTWDHQPQHAFSAEPVKTLWTLLSRCPDAYPPAATHDLLFVTDTALRDVLRLDIAAVERALAGGEWKAATVLAGSVIEALLLWCLNSQDPNTRTSAIQQANASTLGSSPVNASVPLERWTLHQLTEVATVLGLLKSDTPAQVRIARDFRNLIHPGKAQRLGQISDRGTAFAAVGALEHVVRDLS